MTYRDLLKKKIYLCESEKVCRDVAEFFCELQIVQSMYVGCETEDLSYEQEVQLQTYLKKRSKKELLIIGEKYSEKFLRTLEKEKAVYKEDYIWLSDLLEVTDEMETFYIDKMRTYKKIAVYGTGELAEDLLAKNPNIRIDYFVTEDCQKGKFKNSSVIELDKLVEVENHNLFIILAVQIDLQIKQMFLEKGFSFGKDFHFYNPRVPKHTSSYYLKKTLNDKPKYILPCNYTTRALSIKSHGNVMACCSSLTLALGNCEYTSVEEILSGIQAQIVNLAINNRTYSFCGEMCFWFREKAYCLNDEEQINRNERRFDQLHMIPEFNVQLGYDRSCNLACPSCRTHRIVEPEDDKDIVEMIHAEVKSMCKKKPKNLRIGNGELFFSKYYKDIIFNYYESKKIALITNGLLFNPENWEKLERRYEQVALEVSMDATKEETYRKLRGGNFDILLKNMEFASRLRQENKLIKLSISFVIQVENFEEMVEFVQYGNRIHADYIHFMKLNSWGHIPNEEFIKMDVYNPRNSCHKKFVEILHHPIFQSPNVHVDNINNFI